MRHICLNLFVMLIVLGTCSGTAISQEAGKDSIFQKVYSFINKSENDSLRSISESIIYYESGDARISLARKLYESGKRNGDYLRMMYGSSILGANYLLHDLNADSCLFYLNTCLTYKDKLDSAKIEGHRWVAAYAYNTLGLFYINLFADYPKASGYLFEALKLLDEEEYPDLYTIVLANLVFVHYLINDPSGMEYARMCYEYMEEHRNPFTEFLAEFSSAQMQYVCGDFQSAKKSVSRALQLIKHPSIACVKYDVATYSIYARILFALGQNKEAEETALQAIEWSKEDPMPETIETYLVLGDYYKSQKEYTKTIALYEEAADICRNGNVKINLEQVLFKAAEAAELSGDPLKALEYYKQYLSVSKEIFNIAKEYAMEELKAQFKIEQYENQIKEKKLEAASAERQQQMWFFLFVLSLLAGTGIWIFFKKKNTYYKQMVRQYRETMSLNRQLRSIGDNSEEAVRYNSSLTKTKSEELYQQLENLMTEKHIYRDSDISVDKLAAMLHTNRTYLSQVINDKTGMNFSRYIIRNRMSEAIDRLSDPNENVLMKSLAIDLGFKSATAFSKAFAEETGVSPSAYRRTALELDKKALQKA